jgi:hypothetical protein
MNSEILIRIYKQVNDFILLAGLAEWEKSSLFWKLHAACRSKGLLIAIWAATSLTALSFEGAVIAHSIFGYPVEDKDNVDDLNPTWCKVKKEQVDFLNEVSVIFWDEYISNDYNLMEAVLEQLKMLWKKPQYYVFVCAGDFAQVSIHCNWNIICEEYIY